MLTPPPPFHHAGTDTAGVGKTGVLSRRRTYYWLLTYEGRHRRSTAFQLPPEGLWPTPLGAESFRAEWGPMNEEEEEASVRPPLPPGAAAGVLQVDLFETGPVGPGPAKSRGRGAEEEDEEELESYSIYDFNVSRVASARVELMDGRRDRWYACTSPPTGEVVWGLFIHAATWVGDAAMLSPSFSSEALQHQAATVRRRKSRQTLDEDDDKQEEAEEAVRSPPPSPPPLRDHFGFPIAPHAQAEFSHLRSLEELRAIEQRLRWDRIKCFRPSVQRRRCHSAMATTPPVAGAAAAGPADDDSLARSASLRSTDYGLTGLDDVSDSSTGGSKNVEALKGLVWDGIPADIRDPVYQWLSGAQAKREALGANYYPNLAKASEEENLGLGIIGAEGENEEPWVCVSREREGAGVGMGRGADDGARGRGRGGGGGGGGVGVDAEIVVDVFMPELDAMWGGKVAQDIELDLGRAFADADAAINTPEGRAKLRRVLRAYALRNPAVGYCQGMNFIAGLLLLVVSEETAFWALAHMCEDVSPLCFSPPLLGTRADMRALADLLEAELPALYAHCSALHLNLELMAGHWLLVYFINIFPAPVALRILEVSMAEGSDVTFAVALAFLRGLEAELLACDDLHELSQLVRARQMALYDADALLHTARAQLRHMRSRLRISRAWHLGDLMKHEHELEQQQQQRRQQTAGGGGGGGGAEAYMPYLGAAGGRAGAAGGGSAAGVAQRNDDRMRRLMRRSVARGLSLVGLSYWVSPHTWRHWDQMAFQVTHRLFLDEGRFRSMRFTPVLVDLVSWWMNWPILQRRTGGGDLPVPGPASPPRSSRSPVPTRRRHSSSPIKTR